MVKVDADEGLALGCAQGSDARRPRSLCRRVRRQDRHAHSRRNLYSRRGGFLAYLIYPAVARLDLPSWVETRGLQTAGHIVVVLAGTAAAVAMFIIVPMVTAYLLLDLDHPKRSLAAVVPEERWRATVSLLSALVVGVLITGALTPLLLVGADLGGLFGMLVAVPVAAKAS
jgi:hypothetical protein